MSLIALSRFVGEWLPQVDAEMRSVLDNDEPAVDRHYGMLHYHMGWLNQALLPEISPQGKRLRPMLCLLACAEVGGDVARAIPAAAALELLHNFSLIHDDIEDRDETRRHRPTVWKIWGEAQAINAGDGMFALAFAAMQRLHDRGVAPETTLAALRLFTQTCVDLTEGQHLDIGFEQRQLVTVEEYLRMIQGKTAALIAGSVAIGAAVGGAEGEQDAALWRFGHNLGLAFQIQDDILGIWGDPEQTGKPAANDILRRKKSLPILFGLNHDDVGPRMQALFAAPDFGEAAIEPALGLLEEAGTRAYAEGLVQHYHDRGVASLRTALGERASASAMLALSESLLHRDR
jgi:geranylgeranyl diphosphate synthase type I